MAQCHATSKQSGEQCKQGAIAGGTVCVFHGGKAPQVREAARKRLLELVDPALAALDAIVRSEAAENVRLQAAKDILDRVGLSAVTKIEQDIHVFDTRQEILDRAAEIVSEISEQADA